MALNTVARLVPTTEVKVASKWTEEEDGKHYVSWFTPGDGPQYDGSRQLGEKDISTFRNSAKCA